MSRIKTVDPTNATGKAKELLDAVQSQLGVTPNMMRAMANSPAVLQAYLGFNAALAEGALDGKVREQIALAVAEANTCSYCLSAHTVLGKGAGLSEDDISKSRNAEASDPKVTAALKFAKLLVSKRGEVSDADFAQLTKAGLSAGESAEVIANVVLNIFANYFNLAAQTEIDFPKVVPAASKTA